MPPNISALSQYQIRRFFQENDSVTQWQYNAEAQNITSQSVTATAFQGGTSYTVEGGEVVVQFRVPSSHLDVDLIRSIEQAYRGFAPRHEYRGKLGQVSVYTMNNIGGTCMYLARTELQSDNYSLLRLTIDDYTRLANPSHPFQGKGNGASDEQKRRIEAARLIGLFLANGFQQGRPATEESEDLRFRGAVILTP
ncbi:hypothetical protein CH63R_05065 [Colletotrichum higginsianum IMI 349063]|uniref:Uncharacterized protein n=1 Tax=Colletotrichum higginsianum (strain IMI 349063) TaxID=759273 RepID=A0A1B7YL56_COLHI|nr:hypothetical protein CH63R_05065 [Colletotrichum higginsianum IMI 349063]OBR12769.1 hypothetical protein CH63R_05065 [Colletotrichum higginsianum IMI 349063]